jgi:hypothetical protein
VPGKPSLPRAQILELLAAAPARIAALTEGLTPAQLRAAPAPDEWSINDVLAHLRSCADVWGRSIATLIAEDNPTIRSINPRTWIKQTDYPDLEFRPSLAAFTAQRTDLLALLEPLPPDGWSRTATFTGAGSPIVRTVESFAERLVVHERPHIKQIDHIAKTMRTET